ncbi:MAG: helix-turn-helix transcriptional regulator [Lachnospiraceae bacterium]|nr:helix-turn-helix transcriptional regulator [Lachnospiraceae bacterium]
MTFGEQIKQAREAKNLSQEELASRLEVSRQSVSKWENEVAKPQGINKEMLSQILEIELDGE